MLFVDYLPTTRSVEWSSNSIWSTHSHLLLRPEFKYGDGLIHWVPHLCSFIPGVWTCIADLGDLELTCWSSDGVWWLMTCNAFWWLRYCWWKPDIFAYLWRYSLRPWWPWWNGMWWLVTIHGDVLGRAEGNSMLRYALLPVIWYIVLRWPLTGRLLFWSDGTRWWRWCDGYSSAVPDLPWSVLLSLFYSVLMIPGTGWAIHSCGVFDGVPACLE